MQSNVSKNEFVRYEEGAKRYSMCKHTFMKLAQDAHAVYKINRLTLVNTRVFEEYLELFRVQQEFKTVGKIEKVYIKKIIEFLIYIMYNGNRL